jgi:preprotein translocase subunit SecF
VIGRLSKAWSRLYHGETSIDFIGPRRRWFLLSLLLIAIGMTSVAMRGLNLSIEFRGGTAWEVPAKVRSVADTRDALRGIGFADAKIQVLGGDVVRVQADPDNEESSRRVTEALADLNRVDVTQVSVNEVGPSWGANVTEKAQRALILFFIVIAAYISFRFEWKMAVAALAAVVHDIFITVGTYSLSRFEVTPATVIAFLTILGYSLYDTIVVFDRVEENAKGLGSSGRSTYADIVNKSMNQVLMRSLNTSVVAILPILSLLVIGVWFLGATTLQDFGLALLIGLLTGAYSSIFIASPVLAVLKQREPRYQAISRRVEATERAGLLTPKATRHARVPAAAPSDATVSRSSSAPRPAMPNRPRKSSARKKKKRRR